MTAHSEMLNTFVLLVFCATLRFCSADDSPEVTITNGKIRGRSFVSEWTNQNIYAFQGIPYAAPPTGQLRFKDPIPAANWSGTKDCVEDGASCFQPGALFGQKSSTLNLSEDCLFLNVYTPKLQPDAKLPVLVWIHGGAFIAGSGNYYGQGPDKLVAQNITVVTINYRLGSFGFLTLGTPEAPGNAGMKDQLLAMKWVRDEISKFGGDPTKVTIFGESAGSASVHLQYLSPLAKGLFRGVIGDSGTSLGNWAVRSNEGSVFYALQLASLLNCSSPINVTSAYECLIAADASKIIQVQQLGNMSLEDQEIGLGLKFIPTVDKATSNDSFLPEFPAKLMDQKQGSLVPFLMGINQDEGVLGLSGQAQAAENVTNYVAHFIPSEVRKRCSPSELQYLAEKISIFYFNNTPVSDTNIKGLLDINTDGSFAYPTVQSARKFQERGKVFLYYFTFDGSFKEPYFVTLKEKYHNISLVSHAEELNYIFVDGKVNQTISEDSAEVKTWNRMVKMWTNFVIQGSPTVGDDELLQNVQWLPVNQTSTPYLWIDKDLTMEDTDLLADRIALWDLVAASSSVFTRPSLVAVLTSLTLLSLRFM